MAHHQPPQAPYLNTNAGDSTITIAAEMKPVDVPVETLLGVANGAVTGAMFAGGASAAVTVAKEGMRPGATLQNIFRNIIGSHLVGVACGTAAIAALSGIVRFSRARTHNQWREEHYAYLKEQKHADKLMAARATQVDAGGRE